MRYGFGPGFGLAAPLAASGDTTPPALVGQPVVSASGLLVTLTYSEALDPASASAGSAYTLGGTSGIAVASVLVAGSTVVLTPEAEILGVSTVTVSCPSGHVKDLAGNSAAALVSQACTNNSTFFDRAFSIPNCVLSIDTLGSELSTTSAGVSDPGDISKSAWTRTQMTATSATALTVNVGATAPVLQQNINNCGKGNPCVPIVHMFRVKTTGFDFICVETRSATAANRTWFNVTTGAVATSGANHTNMAISAADGNGRRLVQFLEEINGGVATLRVMPCTTDGAFTAPAAGSVLDVIEDATYPGWVYQNRCDAIADRISGEWLYVDPANVGVTRIDVQPGYGVHPLIDKVSIGGLAAMRSVGAHLFTNTTLTTALAAMTGSALVFTVILRLQPYLDDADAAMLSFADPANTNNAISFGFGNGGLGRHRAFFVNGAGTATENEGASDMTNDRAAKTVIWRSDGTTIDCRENGVNVPLANAAFPAGTFTPTKVGLFHTPSLGSLNKINAAGALWEVYNRRLTNAECLLAEADIG